MKTQADLYEAAAKVMRMCEGTDLAWWQCIRGHGRIDGKYWGNIGDPEGLEFALAIVEGRPVFVGDELYDNKGSLKTIYATDSVDWIANHTTWNPPKPKTVMVELLREDAEKFGDTYSRKCVLGIAEPYRNLGSACRKALESK